MNKENPNILISGYYGFGNAGDEAILAAMLQHIKAEIPGANITVLSESPDSTRKEHGVESFQRKNMTGIFNLLGKSDVLLSGGGGLIQDVTGFSTVVYYLSMVLMAKMRGKKVMLYGQGLGPVNQGKSKTVARLVMNIADLITYRDENSKELSLELGINRPPIHVTADPVFGLEPPPPEELAPILHANGIKPDRLKIGISVRPWKTDTDYTSHIAGLADSYIRERDSDIFLFPFQESQDMEICRAVQEKMEAGEAVIIPREYTIPVMMGLLGNMDMVLGMRLHSLIFSVIQAVPCGGISYDPKVTTLMKMMKLPCLDVKDFSRGELFDLARKVFDYLTAIKKKLPGKTSPLKEKARENAKLLKELIYKE